LAAGLGRSMQRPYDSRAVEVRGTICRVECG
jgi:hypothetical protein